MRNAGICLFEPSGGRKYLNAIERRRFVRSARLASAEVRLFCLTLCLSGGRISEVLALTPAAVDLDAGSISLATLKKRRRGVIRQIPLPRDLLDELDRTFGVRDGQRNPQHAYRRIWRWSRTTAWRRVKEIMAQADVSGLAAMPKGLRHSFGVNALQSFVPMHLVQRWLGHASLRTTSIYADVVGEEERLFAAQMWHGSNVSRRGLWQRCRESLLTIWRLLIR